MLWSALALAPLVGAPGSRASVVAGGLEFAEAEIPQDPYSQVLEASTAGDVSGDGRPDLVSAGTRYLAWYEYPDWTPHLIAAGNFGEGSLVVVRDLDADGRSDVITGERPSRHLLWFENGEEGWVRHTLAEDAYCHDLSFGDLDADGRDDIACTDAKFARILWLAAPADPTEAWLSRIIDLRGAWGSQIADIDRDGRPDVVAGRGWYRNAEDGSWPRYAFTTLEDSARPTHPIWPGSHFDDHTELSVLDLDADGRLDVFATLFGGTPEGQVWAFLQPGDPLAEPWEAVEVDAGPLFSVHSQAVADFDGTGRIQILVAEMGIAGYSFGINPSTETFVYRLAGSPRDPDAWERVSVNTFGGHDATATDVDGDGAPDVVTGEENSDLDNPPRDGRGLWWRNLRPAAAPESSVPPVISGLALETETLTASQGGWQNLPSAYNYRWLRCDADASCATINGAAGKTRTLGTDDVGSTLRVVVSASNALGSSDAVSEPTAVVEALVPPQPTSPPAVSGVAEEGHALTAFPGVWSGKVTDVAYEWSRCDPDGLACLPVSGMTAPAYALGPSDVGSTLRVEVTASNAAGSSSATSDPTDVVSPLAPPAVSSLPTVSGEAQETETLSATTGAWSGPVTGYAYAWQRCDPAGGGCLDVPDANDSTYLLGAGDVGATLRVVVTAGNAAGSTAAASLTTPPVQPLPVPQNTSPPTISGVPHTGRVLTAAPGSWEDAVDYGYRWLRCDVAGETCQDVDGASEEAYALADADIGATVRVEVMASNRAGTQSAASAPTPVVQAPPNLLPNPGAEVNPSETWTKNGKASFVWANDAAHSGSRSLRIVAAKVAASSLARWMSVPAKLPIRGGGAYRVSAYSRTTAVSATARLAVSYFRGSKYLSSDVSLATVSGTSAWTRLEFELAAPAKATRLRIELRLYGPGTLWGDDVEVVELDDA